MSPEPQSGIRTLLLDYGGVLAEEGFREGLMTIGRSTAMGADRFFQIAADAVYDSGYLTGQAEEHAYWNMVRSRTQVEGTDEEMRMIILQRFVLRPWMLDLVRNLRSEGYTVCILSDQTQWLGELDKRDDFFKDFDQVFNSYYLGKGKRDASVFTDVAASLKVPPERILFVDDNEGHVRRARSKGLHTILFRDRESFLREMHGLGLM
jgi:putative hydrolase of the HAD superfamily